jgi:hypothetical protein
MNTTTKTIDADTDGIQSIGQASTAVVEQTGRAMATKAQDASMVSMIERIVMDPSIPIDRLEQMLAMKERMEDRAREDGERQAKKAYFAAMSKCQAELPVVIRNRTNDHTKSLYADLAAIEEQAMPIIHKHGFAVSFQPDGYNERGELRIKWEISHEEGHFRGDVAEIPVDGAGSQGKVNKTGTQAFGSTATYGRRYLLCMLFNISTGDDRDGNRIEEPQEFITEEQVMELRDLLTATGGNEAKFLQFIRLPSLDKIYVSAFDKAVDTIKQHRRGAAA